jgi:hypothetical protein
MLPNGKSLYLTIASASAEFGPAALEGMHLRLIFKSWNDAALRDVSTRTKEFEPSRAVEVTFPPHVTTVIELRLVTKGVPYWSRPDLGIGEDDVKVEGGRVRVTVHSLGSVDAPASKVVLRDRAGKVLATAAVPGIKAPVDLFPKSAEVELSLAKGEEWKGGSVTVESSGKVPEITQMNNRVPL